MVDIISQYRKDLQDNVHEFPITAMSEVLAHALCDLLAKSSSLIERALDVGTGNGIHAAILCTSGIKDVLAIDISEDAIQGAIERYGRLLEKSGNGRGFPSPRFEVLDVDQFQSLGRTFQLVVTNPPSFFQPQPSNPSLFNAIESGIYDGERGRWRDPRSAFLYRVFNAIDHILEPGGFAVCTWPGLEKRLAHDLRTREEPVVHPTVLLAQWFGWQFSNAPHASDWPEFYRHRAQIIDYGLGEGFLASLSRDIESGRYSNLMHPPFNGAPSFDFGLLAMRRDPTDPTLFHLMDVQPSLSEDGG